MRKPQWLVVAAMLLFASACNGDAEVQPTPEPTPEPSPTPTPLFQLEGIVIEASGSAQGDEASPSPVGTPTPSPGASPDASPGASPDASPGATDEEGPTQEQATAIEQAAPGSLALSLSTYSGQDTSCMFGDGDTVVVMYTSATTFAPPELTEGERFPNNLVNADVVIEGRVLDEETCVLVANSVATRDQAQASPTADPAGGSGTTSRTSRTPARRATPTARAATPTPAAGGTDTEGSESGNETGNGSEEGNPTEPGNETEPVDEATSGAGTDGDGTDGTANAGGGGADSEDQTAP